MDKNNKSSRFEMRVTPAIKELMQKLADKKQMKVPEFITYLIRREAEKENLS